MEVEQIVSVMLPNQYVRLIKPNGDIYEGGYAKRFLRRGFDVIQREFDVDFIAVDNNIVEIWLAGKETSR